MRAVWLLLLLLLLDEMTVVNATVAMERSMRGGMAMDKYGGDGTEAAKAEVDTGKVDSRVETAKLGTKAGAKTGAKTGAKNDTIVALEEIGRGFKFPSIWRTKKSTVNEKGVTEAEKKKPLVAPKENGRRFKFPNIWGKNKLTEKEKAAEAEKERAAKKEKQGVDGQKLGQAVLGFIFGAGIGEVFATSTIALSGGGADSQDRTSFLLAGGFGGAIVAFSSDARSYTPEKLKNAMKIPVSERMNNAKRGFGSGMITGIVGGAIAQVGSGSFDEGASSASSQSSASSSSLSDMEKLARDDDGVGAAVDIKRLPSSVAMSGNMLILHVAIAGGIGGAAAAYFEPEILWFGGSVGGRAIDAAKIMKTTADRTRERAMESNEVNKTLKPKKG